MMNSYPVLKSQDAMTKKEMSPQQKKKIFLPLLPYLGAQEGCCPSDNPPYVPTINSITAPLPGDRDEGRRQVLREDTAVLQHVGRAEQSRRCHLRPALVPPYPVRMGISQPSEAEQGSPGPWGNRQRTVSVMDLSCPTWHSQSHLSPRHSC